MKTIKFSKLATVLENVEILTVQEKEKIKGGGVIQLVQAD